MAEATFVLEMPRIRRSGVVFASPHSGDRYDDLLFPKTILETPQIRSSEDAFVHQLFDCVPELGAPFLRAIAPRAYLDLNRATDELDPALIAGLPKRGQNPRIASGLGVIPRVVAGGRAIYRGKLSMEEARRRIHLYWHPYHAQLRRLMEAASREYGVAILIDCHSMPHEAVSETRLANGKKPDIVLGDRFGASASGHLVDQIEAAFVRAGLTVVRNAPFAGAYITQTYGRPSRNQHAIQIEIDRALYMNEAKVEPHEGFAPLQAVLRTVASDLIELGRDYSDLAAE
ncbi:N-formylglutamate amidohydrolase [Epibacterium ulvae]|uniref:N-formylglutamate amidohydrolase n=1 Tax=Epibacterium ulvae TaxID=1156985 RepID=UPI0024913ABB|nr:N-formylglutamate amidohydrolase [Epibacterium ulvae]